MVYFWNDPPIKLIREIPMIGINVILNSNCAKQIILSTPDCTFLSR